MSLPTPDGHNAAFPTLGSDLLGAGWYVCDEAGRCDPLRSDLERWCGEVDAVDLLLLSHAEGRCWTSAAVPAAWSPSWPDGAVGPRRRRRVRRRPPHDRCGGSGDPALGLRPAAR
jgi:hypothetical protein